MQGKRRKAVRGAMAAAGLSGALVLGHATNTTAMVALANTVIGIGGQGDTTSANLPAKLSGTVVPAVGDYHYVPVQYPASLALDRSRDAAVPIVHQYLMVTGKDEAHLIVAGYSLGTMAVEQERRNLQLLGDSVAPSPDQLTFVMIGSPFAGNGGIFGRFPGLGIPFVTAGMGSAQPSRYDTTHNTNMYDGYGDFPAYFNPLSLLNAALAIHYGHPDEFYDPLDPATSYAYVTKVDDPVTGSTDHYVLYYNPHLPLLAPLRELASMAQLSGVTEPLISAVEPLLRVVVDMGYTDRINANPAASVPFSFITPPAKIIEALSAIPGALAQGAANLASGGQANVAPPDPSGNLVPVSAAIPSAALEVPESSDAKSAQARTTPTAPKLESPTEDDGLHPTVTSDGNKFTPGTAGAVAQNESGEAPVSTTTDTGTGTGTEPNPPSTTDADPPATQSVSDTGSDAASTGTAAAA